MSLTRKDFETSNEVRWCPGCGDYAVLASMQKMLPALEMPKEKMVFVSGIGCSSRFPYYLNTYGFHTIHGRAPTIATGLRLTRPDLKVWIVTGDGDGLSIGANHLLHIMRRNLDVTIVLFNNRIYGLTKGQYSPTSERGKITKSTPQGSLDEPVNPVRFALSAGCSFVARAIDVDADRLQKVLLAGARHKGTAFIEVLQNCNVFNDGAFASFADRGLRQTKTVSIFPNEPLRFGEEMAKGLRFEQGKWETTEASNALVWSEDLPEALPYTLSTLEEPVPIGIFRAQSRPCYEEGVKTGASSKDKLAQLLHSGDTWEQA